MSEFRVTYQDVPFNSTSARSLMVEAETKAAAFITAYDYLSRGGQIIQADKYSLQDNYLGLTDSEVTEIRAAGIPERAEGSRTHILEITRYTVKSPGTIIAG